MDVAHIFVLLIMLILLMSIKNKHFKKFFIQSTLLTGVLYILYVFMRGDYLSDEMFLFIDIMYGLVVLHNVGYYILAHKLGIIEVKIPEDDMVTQLAMKRNIVYDKNKEDKEDKEDKE